MQDNEIIKALECHLKDYRPICCCCPMRGEIHCQSELRSQTLDLINRLKVENDDLKKRIVFWREDMNYNPERERADAINEFTERVKELTISKGIYPVFFKNILNEAKKEMGVSDEQFE